jgi:hypothetical protein
MAGLLPGQVVVNGAHLESPRQEPRNHAFQLGRQHDQIPHRHRGAGLAGESRPTGERESGAHRDLADPDTEVATREVEAMVSAWPGRPAPAG